MTNAKRIGALLLALLSLLACLGGCTKQEEAETVFYTVTFDSNGGSPVEPQRVAAGATVSVVSPPTREGYLFDAWKTESGSLWDFANDYPSADMTLTAVWIPATEVFGYEPLSGGNAKITKLKKLMPVLTVPQTLGGYSVTAIGDGVFAELQAHQVQKITLPQTVTAIGEEAFYGCTEIEISIDPRAVLTELGAGAFYGCSKLDAVTIGEGMTELPPDVFFGCQSLKEIRIPKSITLLQDNAFADCRSLITVMLPAELLTVCDSAFKDCTSLRTVYYYGTEEQLSQLRENTANQNDLFLNATFYFYSATQPTRDGNYWYLNDNDRPKFW